MPAAAAEAPADQWPQGWRPLTVERMEMVDCGPPHGILPRSEALALRDFMAGEGRPQWAK